MFVLQLEFIHLNMSIVWKVTWLVISVQYADKVETNEYAFTGGLINLKITLIDAIVR